MQDTHRIQETYPQEGIDSKAYLLCFLRRIPYMLLIGLTGAIIGSGLYLLIAAINNRTTVYMQETEYYIDFAPGRIDAKDYYNAFTWNDVMGTDLIMDRDIQIQHLFWNRRYLLHQETDQTKTEYPRTWIVVSVR